MICDMAKKSFVLAKNKIVKKCTNTNTFGPIPKFLYWLLLPWNKPHDARPRGLDNLKILIHFWLITAVLVCYYTCGMLVMIPGRSVKILLICCILNHIPVEHFKWIFVLPFWNVLQKKKPSADHNVGSLGHPQQAREPAQCPSH